ncbi:hypothetical protein M407DRAFT_231653 [Tulasnella calospora MUT 4182]|uniref:Uncharacterized protein n=1 Tax=Tulasnella calospora MUT 4182 TaxID=1051891 RepID=A0A0C3MIP2_9AGAM|nr:hypothetical protein M407DRAFT_231653 [Tulasnella calospora MUT 4182]
MWDPETFRGLRKLVLGNVSEDFMLPDNVLAILAANPLLELLDIVGEGFEPLLSPPPPSTRAPIHLPKLKTILLSVLCEEAVASVLASIRVPNCESLQLTDLEESISADSSDKAGVLDQALGHFDGFLRSSLALYGSSRLRLFKEGVNWLCQRSSSGLYAPGFELGIPWGNPHSNVLWVLQVLGPLPDSTHRIKLDIRIDDSEVDVDVLTGLKAPAFLPNVQKLEVSDTLHSVIFDLLGSAKDIAGFPAFSSLEKLKLPMPYNLPHSLRSLEVALKSRYAKSKRGAARARPMRIIFSGEFYRPECSPLEKRLRFDRLCRIRALQGVESVELVE